MSALLASFPVLHAIAHARAVRAEYLMNARAALHSARTFRAEGFPVAEVDALIELAAMNRRIARQYTRNARGTCDCCGRVDASALVRSIAYCAECSALANKYPSVDDLESLAGEPFDS